MTTPSSTYRVQLHAGFTFEHAVSVVDYLSDFGVSHVYLSPILQATRGSTHGYDIVDPTRIDEERGGEKGVRALAHACRDAGLGLVVDVVPNHLDISSDENRWWQTVLALGPACRLARVFDVEWTPAGDSDPSDTPKVTLPILGETLPEVLDHDRLALRRRAGWVYLEYFDHRLPLASHTVRRLVEASDGIGAALDEAGANAELDRLAARLDEALQAAPNATHALDEQLAAIAADRDRFQRLIDEQHYRLVLWRKESRELNYRRFFDINTMIGTRVEREDVFDALHATTLGLVHEGLVDGLRVDHPDGLRDPARYFDMLARKSGGAWIVAEKILEADEDLPDDWSVAGTTGYDFLNDALGVLVDPEAEDVMTAHYADFARVETVFPSVAFEAKRASAHTLLAADLGRLTDTLASLAGAEPRLDTDRSRLAETLVMLAASTRVYRTYIAPGDTEVSARDREVIEHAAAETLRLRPDLAPDPLSGVVDLLLKRFAPPDDTAAAIADEFVTRFQQFTAPVMAKGVEDTAFYRYHRLLALNEVGGDPGRFGLDVETFHARCMHRADRWPRAMLTTATHDTKRSEDVRARLAVLSELAEDWGGCVRAWATLSEQAFPDLAAAVDDNTEYLLYQTIVGAWPIEADRVVEFVLKAVKEAKTHTSWRDPNETYEEQLEAFARAILDHAPFTESVASFVDRLLVPARTNAVTQVLLRMTCPGVPDTYQGAELWDNSLVDPDNRRLVDFELRRTLLARLDGTPNTDLWHTLSDPDDPGLAKLATLRAALRVRRDHPDAFDERAGYEALPVVGEHADRVIAFARNDESWTSRVCVVVPRFNASRAPFDDTSVRLPPAPNGGVWTNVLLGDAGATADPGPVPVADLFRHAAAALLVERSP